MTARENAMPAPNVTPLSLKPSGLTIEIGEASGPDATHEAETERRWAELCARNPRLFNGPILACNGYDPATKTLRARVSEYKRLAVQRDFESREPHGTTILSVTGVLTASAPDNTRCVCVAQRSGATRVYGGRWELAPSGGIDVPTGVAEGSIDGHQFDGSLALRALKAELAEELGLDEASCDWPTARVLGLVLDERAGSLDVMFHVEHVPDPGARPVRVGSWRRDGESSWEYEAVSWVPIEALPAFGRTNPCIGPMVDAIEAGLLDGL